MEELGEAGMVSTELGTALSVPVSILCLSIVEINMERHKKGEKKELDSES